MTMRCSKRRTLIVLAGCAVWLAVLGWVDRTTGYELGLFALYTAPVGVVAWNLGRGPGIMAAFIASVIWYMADRYAGDRYSTSLLRLLEHRNALHYVHHQRRSLCQNKIQSQPAPRARACASGNPGAVEANGPTDSSLSPMP